jgi:hypothetical protein
MPTGGRRDALVIDRRWPVAVGRGCSQFGDEVHELVVDVDQQRS